MITCGLPHRRKSKVNDGLRIEASPTRRVAFQHAMDNADGNPKVGGSSPGDGGEGE